MPGRLLADVNRDGRVGVEDLFIVVRAIGTTPPQADLNGDGLVSVLDLSIVARFLRYPQKVCKQSGGVPSL